MSVVSGVYPEPDAENLLGTLANTPTSEASTGAEVEMYELQYGSENIDLTGNASRFCIAANALWCVNIALCGRHFRMLPNAATCSAV